MVSSLIALTKAFGLAFGLLTSWEEMVAEFVRSDDITSKVSVLYVYSVVFVSGKVGGWEGEHPSPLETAIAG